MKEYPLVSIAMVTYMQEDFVADAVRSVLQQTYPNLEIIISDDCSTDRTWQIILETVEVYRRNHNAIHHNIQLVRNEKNLGLIGNCEQSHRMCHGTLIISHAGDDISLPNRVERIVEEWKKHSCIPVYIQHCGRFIDLKGNDLGPIRGFDAKIPLGAAEAYSIRVFKEWPAIDKPNLIEDWLYSRRGMLLSDPLYIDEELFLYRRGSGISSKADIIRARKGKFIRDIVDTLNQIRIELEDKRSDIPKTRYEYLLADWQYHFDYHSKWDALLNSSRFQERYLALKKVLPARPFRSVGMLFYSSTLIALLLPPGLCDLVVDSLTWLYEALHNRHINSK